eukprot:TRINITY_DN51927_c0_g1_i1.p1 TRINITY_DN51927_c0_g1~~TRINITY_DN51927_c0_g1_i1.p1  ORF type:complete len:158 (+),score=20.46 TRINITY_DN51927_c0_g1_i1:267-740(+)
MLNSLKIGGGSTRPVLGFVSKRKQCKQFASRKNYQTFEKNGVRECMASAALCPSLNCPPANVQPPPAPQAQLTCAMVRKQAISKGEKYPPTCADDGNYTPVQRGVNYNCYCVNPCTGAKKKKGTESFALPSICSPNGCDVKTTYTNMGNDRPGADFQ